MGRFLHNKATTGPKQAKSGLGIKNRAKNGDYEMGEVFGAFIELKPANDAMLGEIFSGASFGNAQMIGEKGFNGNSGTAIATAGDVCDGDAKGVASFDVIVSGHFFVGENENARARGSAVGLIEFCGRASEEAPELHFEERDA